MSREMHIDLPDRFTDHELTQLRDVIAAELAAHRAELATLLAAITPPRDYWTAADAARAFHVHENTIYDLIERGEFPAARLTPRVIRICPAEAYAWYRAHHNGAAVEAVAA